jgi:DNA-binding SARP family transcriptional activator
MPVRQVQLLGAARATFASETVTFLPDKRYLFLAYLAYRGDWVHREELAYLFWSEVSDAAARHSLRQLLKRVKHLDWLLGLEADPQRIRWSVPTDVAALRAALDGDRIEEAVLLYRGPLLGALHATAAPEYDQWLEVERRRLHEAWRSAVFRRGRRLEAEGERLAAGELYAGLLAQDPYDEEALTAQLHALAGAGRGRTAVRTWRSFAHKLRDDLGLEPSAATSRVAARIEAELEGVTQPDAAPGPTGAGDAASARRLPSTSFIGREGERAEIARLLMVPGCRMLTITGPAGVGKSRLAAKAAEELASRYPDGVRVARREGSGSSTELLEAIGTCSRVEEALSDEGALAALRERIGTRRMLLVLDDVDRLVAGPEVLGPLIVGCPHLDLVATSRHPLGLDEECALPIEGLPWPRSAPPNEDDPVRYDAVRLFLDRAQQLGAFVPEPSDLPHVVRVCAAVRGVPLAIELAAAWTLVLPAETIAREVEHNAVLLASTNRSAPDRRHGMRSGLEPF